MNSKLKNLIFTCAGKGARIPFVNSLRLRGAKLSVNRSIVLHTRIDCKGKNNTIHFEDGCILNKCRINIRGDNNEIYFHKGICAEFTELWIEDDNNQIVIGETPACTDLSIWPVSREPPSNSAQIVFALPMWWFEPGIPTPSSMGRETVPIHPWMW